MKQQHASHRIAGIVLAATLAAAMPTLAQDSKTALNRASQESNATVLAAQLLSRWAPVAQAAGRDLALWQDQFATQFRLMSVGNLQTIDRVPVSSSLSAAQNLAHFSQAFRSVMVTAHAEAGKSNPKLGSATADQVFIPITPCRVVDTRNFGGPLSAGTTRNFYYWTQGPSGDWSTQGGPAGPAGTTCPGTINPDGGAPSAAVATITVVSPTAAGNFNVWSGANPRPLASALNWRNAGDVVANTTAIPAAARTGTGPGGVLEDFAVYYNGPSGSANVVVDVVGYFVENQATPLDCVNTDFTSVTIPINSAASASSPACATELHPWLAVSVSWTVPPAG